MLTDRIDGEPGMQGAGLPVDARNKGWLDAKKKQTSTVHTVMPHLYL